MKFTLIVWKRKKLKEVPVAAALVKDGSIISIEA